MMLILDLSNKKEVLFNREVSWLDFNERILAEAERADLPLLERLKFISIAASNLNEFITVRSPAVRNLNYELYLELLERINQLIIKRFTIWKGLKTKLAENFIIICDSNNLTQNDKIWMKDYFLNNILKLVKVADLKKANLEGISNFFFPVTILKYRQEEKIENKIISLSKEVSRFVRLPSKEKLAFIKLEDIILENIHFILPQIEILEINHLFFTRNSLVNFPEIIENNYLPYLQVLRKREKAEIITILTDNKHTTLMEEISNILKLQKEEILELEDLAALPKLYELYNKINGSNFKSLKYNEYKPKHIPLDLGIDIKGSAKPDILYILSYLEERDLLFHHPYDSFDSTIKFLSEAASDPEVISINQTIYRTNYHSPIMLSLIQAAKNGKDVTVIIELKARFSEKINLYWAKKLEKNGVKVICTSGKIKAHLKLSLVEKKIGKVNKGFLHFSTGNYHSETAKFYSDLSYFTSQNEMIEDVRKILNFLKYQIVPENLNKFILSPFFMRNQIIALIRNEIQLAHQGKETLIIMKLNALVDEEIIASLYQASVAGVKIQLIVRGICCLKPGIKSFSDNITVKSIVGRFLEHSRILFFSGGEGIQSSKSKIFISSADMMPRNFDERVEAILLIENKNAKNKIYNILEMNLEDEKQSWQLEEDKYIKKEDKSGFSVQKYFMDVN